MGLVKQWILDNEYNNSLVDFLKELLERDELSGAIEGISKRIVDQGIDSLSGKQRPAIESFVQSYTKGIECPRCVNGNVTALTDYIHIEEEGLCPMCEYDRVQAMKD